MGTNLTDSDNITQTAAENKFEDELVFRLALTQLPGVGHGLAKTLVSYCGSAGTVFKERQDALKKIPGIGSIIADNIKQGKTKALALAESELGFIQKHKIKALFYTDKEYPSRLKLCNDGPAMLFVKGNCNFNASKVLAFVGTRNATEYGKSITEQLIQELSLHDDLLIVSGLAYGIDIAAHKACLKNEIPTVGVVAHGLDSLYPAIHKSTADKMMEKGGIISDFISGTKPDKENFPSRNRIVAGMSDAVIVVESAIKGGALITADIANSYNRDVFAIPGNVHNEYSKGCNAYIRDNKANLIQSVTDIEFFLGWDLKKNKNEKKQVQATLFLELPPDERKLVDYLKQNIRSDIDSICMYSGLAIGKIPNLLLTLELKGLIKVHPGKVYELI
ncbi:MAG: DNA-protecting protein DprA [Bacteroidia bacterium]|nr:DNA-protecting protein DprA [Bacteroidia bacterium]